MNYAVMRMKVDERSRNEKLQTFAHPPIGVQTSAQLFIPMVIRIQRHAINIAAHDSSGFLQPLLVTVMAVLAQALPVLSVPEKFHIPTMRNDVVNDYRSDQLAALFMIHAQRMFS